MSRLIPHRATYLHEAERAQQIAAQLQVDALLARVRQHDTSGCSDHDADETNAARWELVIAMFVIFPLCAWAYHLPAVQAFLHFLRMQP
ncbi:hypothetical protein B0E46_15685 [Rhodanobacter sp. B04]|uniref:hypothetical protein n=1 Tax=Rhodanobacter sp. B04 TaxID=1945860 RepID=UPI000985DEB1|nr:hypothetical protein [Rhodanobacter sp. B04]OOG61419.1 hypothetical protein B0E46_15685 [Rhodanobacter sp. B04]